MDDKLREEKIKQAEINALKKERALNNARIKAELLNLGVEYADKVPPKAPSKPKTEEVLVESSTKTQDTEVKQEISELKDAISSLMAFTLNNAKESAKEKETKAERRTSYESTARRAPLKYRQREERSPYMTVEPFAHYPFSIRPHPMHPYAPPNPYMALPPAYPPSYPPVPIGGYPQAYPPVYNQPYPNHMMHANPALPPSGYLPPPQQIGYENSAFNMQPMGHLPHQMPVDNFQQGTPQMHEANHFSVQDTQPNIEHTNQNEQINAINAIANPIDLNEKVVGLNARLSSIKNYYLGG